MLPSVSLVFWWYQSQLKYHLFWFVWTFSREPGLCRDCARKPSVVRRGRQRIDREDSGAQLTARLASISTPLVSRTYTVLSQPLYTQLLPYHKLQLTFLTSSSVFRCGSIALHLCLPSRAFLCKVHILTDSSGVSTNTKTNTSVDNISEVWILLIKTPRRAR